MDTYVKMLTNQNPAQLEALINQYLATTKDACQSIQVLLDVVGFVAFITMQKAQ